MKKLFSMSFLVLCYTLSFAQLTFTGSAPAPNSELSLWYRTPATEWMTSALPIGNGRIGAMVFGGIPQEHLQFNDKTLWTGNTTQRGAYQNFGDLYLDFPAVATVNNYRRELDLNNAVSRVTYEANGVTYNREYFTSYVDNAIIMRLSSSAANAITFDASIVDAHTGTMTVSGNKITFKGALTLLSYEAQLVVNNDGGTITADGNKLKVNGANAVTLVLALGTNYDPTTLGYVGFNATQLSTNITNQASAASAKAYSSLYANHVADYKSLFDRVKLNLGNTKPTVPTDKLQAMYNGGITNTALDILYFQYGRYLMISSARGMALPSNLQGLWNNSNTPPWQADIHTNINVQMNYWPAETTNLSELHTTLTDYVYNEAMVQPSWGAHGLNQSNAGWTLKTQSNIFGYTDWEWNRPANAWFAMHLWQHYAFTLDNNYLQNKAYPAMKAACDFWLGRLVTAPDGKLVAPNEWSPEQGPWEDGVAYAQQLIWNLFENTIKANIALNADPAYLATLQNTLAKLDNGIAIGAWGQIREWRTNTSDDTNPNNNHRHISHLIALYPGDAISPLINTTYSDAAIKSLNGRGDAGPGWSRAWKINTWARLLNGNRAYSLIQAALQNTKTITNDGGVAGGAYENLLDAHPPFQIDGNFGATAGIAEMLVQSHLGKIQLLPAIPSAWPNGSVQGLKAMNNFTVDITWNNGGSTTAKIYSGSGKNCVVYYKDINTATITDSDNNPVTFTVNSSNEIEFPTVSGKTYTIAGLNFQVQTDPVLLNDGVYKLISRRTSKLIGAVSNALFTDNTSIEQRSLINPNVLPEAQQWLVTNLGNNIVKITSPVSGKALTMESTASAAKATIADYNADSKQHFRISTVETNAGITYYRITPMSSQNMGFDVNGGSTSDGALIIQYSFGGGTNQQWQFDYVGAANNSTNLISDDSYLIKSRSTQKYVGPVNNTYGVDNTLIEQNALGNTNDLTNGQSWNFVNLGYNVVKIINKAGNKALSVVNTNNASNLQLLDYSNVPSQQFYLSLAGTANGVNYYRITPLTVLDKGFDVNGGSSNNGVKIITYTYGGGNNQQWQLINALILPVDLINFSVKVTNLNNAILDWTTGLETNNNYFIVERSQDGKNFELVGQINAKGNHQQYHLTDRNLSTGTYIYKLIQVDKNGTRSEIGLKSISIVLNSNKIIVFPNPLHDNIFQINGLTEKNNSLSIVNNQGLTIYKNNFILETGNSYQVKLKNKPSKGVYLILNNDKLISKLLVD